jgi:TetR/AcrR family transcriptional repressor of nem operon
MARTREFDEETVLGAARDAFWVTGYSGTSMDDLMTATGLYKGSLYAAFGGKKALFDRIVDEYSRAAVAEAQNSLIGPDTGALSRLQKYLRDGVTLAAASPGRRGCLLAKAAAELAVVDPALRKRIRRTYDAIIDALRTCLKGAQRSGEIDLSVDIEEASYLIFAAMRGLEALSRSGMSKATLSLIAESALNSLAA